MTMIAITICLFLLADPSTSGPRVSWSDVVSVVSIVFSGLLSVLLWLLNRKHEAEQELRKKNQAQLDEATVRVREGDLARQQIVTQLDQHRREFDALHAAVGELADDAVVSEIRGDFRAMKRDLEEARISLAGHQNSCADRFVHRSSYSEDQRALREAIGLLHEMLKQQRDLIERMRSNY